MNAKHCGASVSEALAQRTLAATHPQQLFWLLLSSQCHCRWPGEMTTLLVLELALCCCNVTYRQPGDIYGNAVRSLCRCRLLCESIPKLHCSHRGHVNNLEYYGNYLKRYIETRNDMRYVRTYVRTPYAQTNSPLNTLVWGSLTLTQ